MADPDLRDRIAVLMEQYLALPRSEVLADAPFFELGCDSLDVVEMGLIIEREGGVDLEGKITGRNMPANLSGLIKVLRETLPAADFAALASRIGAVLP